MALKKKVTAKNGVPLEYHRVTLVTIDVNNRITVLTHSYLSEEARQIEKDYAAGLIEGTDVQFPYVDYEYRPREYEDGMTVEKAYEWLKTLPEFADAEDV